jgi:uncharacterized protein YecT (DUF1311 family)
MLAAVLLASPAAAQTQVQMNEAAARGFARADAAMTREWQLTYAAMKRMDAANRGGFRYAATTLASQRAWLAFRDAECVIEGGEFAGGSLQSMTEAQCRARLTNDRAAQLRTLRWRR